MVWVIFIEILADPPQIKKVKILIVFDNMVADMHNNKKLNPIVTELFIRYRKLNISLAFINWSFERSHLVIH